MRTKKFMAMLLSVVMVLTMMPLAVFTASAEDTGGLGEDSKITGTGTASDPYIIKDVDGLNELADRVNGKGSYSNQNNFDGKYFKLSSSFDNKTNPFTKVIGVNPKSQGGGFAGIFDGNNATVTLDLSNSIKDYSSTTYIAMFGCNNGTIKNLTVDREVKITLDAYGYSVAGVCAKNEGEIVNCINKANISSERDSGSSVASAGGVCCSNDGTILNCSNQGKVSAKCGSGSNAQAGGISGSNGGKIINCYNTGDIKSDGGNTAKAGGICAEMGSSAYTVCCCYSSGTVAAINNNSAKVSRGGVCGRKTGGTIESCFYKQESGLYGIGKTGNDAVTSDEGTGTSSFTDDNAGLTKLLTALNEYKTDNNLFEAKEWKAGTDGYPTFETINVALSGGTGTESDPYLVKTLEDLNTLGKAVNTITENYADKYIKLDSDITGVKLQNGCIGGSGKYVDTNNPQNTFAGTFDGNGKSIELAVSDPEAKYIGLFGYNAGTIKNLTTTGSVTVTKADRYVAGICANNAGDIINCKNKAEIKVTLAEKGYCNVGGVCFMNTGTISDSSNEANVTATALNAGVVIETTQAGGVCCYSNTGSKIINCYNTGIVKAEIGENGTTSYVFAGGVCFQNNESTIEKCYNAGEVTAKSNYCATAGGVCYASSGTIKSSYNTDEVTAKATNTAWAGGVCCKNGGDGDDNAIIVNSYNTGDVKAICTDDGEIQVGGVSAYNSRSITNCFNTGNVSASRDKTSGYSISVGGICGVNKYDQSGGVANCYNTGNISANDDSFIGGICGKQETPPKLSNPVTTNRNKNGGSSSNEIENCYYLDTSVPKGCGGIGYDEEAKVNSADVDGKAEKITEEEIKNGKLTIALNEYVDDTKKVGDIELEGWYVCSVNNGCPVFGYVYNSLDNATVTAIDLAVTAPQAGQKLADKATFNVKSTPVNTVTPTVDSVNWEDNTGNYVKMAECSKEYTVDVTLSATVAEGYKLAVDPALKVTVNGKEAKVTLNSDNTITVSYTFDKVQHVWDDGKIIGNGKVRLFTCTVCQKGLRTEYVKQAKQTITVKKKYTTKKATVKIKAKAKTKLSFKLLKKSKYYKVTKNGKIKFSNGAENGTYKIKVRITAKGTNSYKKATVKKTITVKVK